MFIEKLWQKDSSEPIRNDQGQIVAWGKESGDWTRMDYRRNFPSTSDSQEI